MGRHPLAGHHSVDESARLVRHYRYAEERLMRLMGGWIALTPELSAKLLFGRHVWDCAQHADLWGRRLPELRSPAQQSEAANEGVVACFDLLESREAHGDTPERVAGVYRVVKPHLVALYERHLANANAVYEPPTVRILERCLDEERRHVAAGARVFTALVSDAAVQERARQWEDRLREALTAAGGVTGAGAVTGMTQPHPLADRDVVTSGGRFDAGAVPPDLASAIARHVAALADEDGVALERGLAPAAGESVRLAYARLGPVARGSDIVGHARIGGHRMIKVALGTAEGRAIVQQHWRREDGEWRLVAAQIVRLEPATPA